MQYIQKYFAYFACFYLFIMSIVQLFLLIYVASFTVVNFFLWYCMHGLPDDGASEWKIDGNYVYARSKRQHHWLPSKILSKLFPSFRMYEEKMANLLSKDGDGKYEPNLGKNTTHSSWNDEEQHPELLKELLAW